MYMTLQEHYDEERNIGKEEGRTEGQNELLFRQVNDGVLTPGQGAGYMNVSTADFIKKMEAAGYKLPAAQ